ncbi:hypothetical protein [Tabrizicola sp.]
MKADPRQKSRNIFDGENYSVGPAGDWLAQAPLMNGDGRKSTV